MPSLDSVLILCVICFWLFVSRTKIKTCDFTEEELIAYRAFGPKTQADRDEQIISHAWHNLRMSNPEITKDFVREQFNNLRERGEI